ncbi:MAG: hypothetical protein IPI06_14045 [Gammaproteobacteria bacterium]|nr:hypothetical protein [Gammaproteobacteria bacterium]
MGRGLGQLPPVYGGGLKTLTFEVELKGAGAAGTAPEFDALLEACGLKGTNVASTSETYAPDNGGGTSCTIYYFEAAAAGSSQVRHILTGCRGTFSLSAEAGGIPVLSFTMTGHSAVPTTQNLPSPTFDSTVPVTMKNLTVTVNSVKGAVQSFSLDLGNSVITPADMNAADGYGEVTIAERAPSFQLTRHNELIATISPWGDLVAGTARAITTGDVGTAGNIWSFSAPKATYVDVSPGEVDGIRQSVSRFMLGPNSTTSDELSLQFK